MKTLGWIAITVCLAWWSGRATAGDEPPPNIVVVFIDDLGWGDFSCFGNQQASTPAIDRLAAEGIRVSQFYVNSPICSPSRVAITTGHYPQRWRITSFLNSRADNERRGMAQWLDPAAPTLARRLQEHGYRTGHFGKWHMGGQRDVADAPPIAAYGFDESLTNFEGMGPKLLPLTLTPGGEVGRIWEDAERLGGPVEWMQRSEITGGYVAAAIGFIDRAAADGRPFYVNLWPDDVHSPYWPAVDDWSRNRGEKYRAVLESMDRQLDRLFSHIRDRPALRDNTLILVCSDNGPEPRGGLAGPFRGAKTTLYEGGIRSPLVVWGPGLLAPGAAGVADDESVFAAFDLVPSLLAIAGVAPNDAAAAAGIVTGTDGTDVSQALLGRQPVSHVGPLCWRRPPDRKTWGPLGDERQPDLAIREGTWKLLCDYDGGNPQLYELETDRGEQRNVAGGHLQEAARLTETLLAWHRSMPADRGPALGAKVSEAVQP